MRLSHPLALLCAALALVLAGCSGGGGDRVDVVFIGEAGELEQSGLRLSPAGQHLRAATAEGLVALDAAGGVVPAVAERWVVTDDGLSYIFRLRNSAWDDGEQIEAEHVRDELRAVLRRLRGTSLGLDLAKVSEVRAMTGRVIEIRLTSPLPDLLQILAQPELGLRRAGAGMGPMIATDVENGWLLQPSPPETRGLPEVAEWNERIRQIFLRVLPADEAVAAFDAGAADLVLNGTLANLPLADVGALSRGTVRLDAALGLFGLRVRSGEGLLADAARREALAMAIDRPQLLQPFNIGGWVPTTRIVAPGLPDDIGTIDERWSDLSLEARRGLAARRIAGWVSGEDGRVARVTLALPPGPGSDMLFARLANDFAAIGVTLDREDDPAQADLVLVDRVARYGAPRWFLNQFACSLDGGLCVPEADARVEEALSAQNTIVRAALYAEAEAELAASNVYIPIGAPIRWSLVRGGVEGFQENRWNIHPLLPLAMRPI
ncbi:ABC transporter substrate-binding protein [Pelagerythrobacter marensis]|uniref:Putative dipeptide-binding ABC transporter protein n=1 Tax=Pelagerythrobacter marensis TaxID=543877 RepID=A0A0G3XA91_9SPHN|nr:ABC transporter substrate-binding protein [Pelagerythrobacter marensis]AKM08097.1 Putative dipeptide-binding ABC transporter protein [Pelagerythrobacter marensis]